MRYFCLIFYYFFATHLPGSYMPYGGRLANALRVWCCRHIFKKCGNITTVDREAYFGNGRDIEMGDFSGIGAHCSLPNDLIMGTHIMMAPRVTIMSENHCTSRTDIPMCEQGYQPRRPVRIEDDCWLCTGAIITPGVTIRRGTIVAAGAVVSKSFPEYSVLGGNPARVIKNRKDNNDNNHE